MDEKNIKGEQASIKTSFFENWKAKAKALKHEVYALFLAYKDPRVPWYAKAFSALVVGYAFSPIDLIPDMIPVLGYLDDLVLVPLGVALAIKMIPAEVMEECPREIHGSHAIRQAGQPHRGSHHHPDLGAGVCMGIQLGKRPYLEIKITKEERIYG